MSNYDPLFTMAALNIAIVSLHRITSTQDRVILDQEYKNIINNLRMGEINADLELTELYQEIVRVINRGRLENDVRKSIEETYSRKKQKGIKSIIYENILSSFDADPLRWLSNLAISCASEYFGLKNPKNQTQQDNEQLKLKSQELGEYDELQRKLLASSWALLRKYQLSDNYRLTQNALDKFYSTMQENDPSRRFRMLKRLESEFSMYSPYWFYRVISANEVEDKTEAEKSFSKFNEVWRPVLRKDPYKIEALKFQIEKFMVKGINAENTDKILECLSEIGENTEIDDWANNIYEGTLYFMLGNRKKAVECVICNLDFGLEIEASRKLLTTIEEADSQYKSAELCYRKKEYTEAVKWYSKAAEQNNSLAQFRLGGMYYNGNGVSRNNIEAIKWFSLAANQGYAPAQFSLGIVCYLGEGVPEDKAEAIKWFNLAAKQGYAPAQNELGEMYEHGDILEQDKAKAIEYYRLAVKQGYVFAQYNLGRMYECGDGVKQGKAKAVKCYRLAAKQGHAQAQYRLGCMYAKGEGVPQIKAEAIWWFRKAAQQGYISAQNMLKQFGETWEE